MGVFVGPSNQYQAVPPNHLNSLKDITIVSGTGGAGRPVSGADNLWTLIPPTCNGTTADFPMIENVRVYSPGATTTICGALVAEFQAPPGRGYVRNVTTADIAALKAMDIVRWAHETLALQ